MPNADYVVKGVLSSLERFPNDLEKIHRAFYSLKNRYPAIMGDFIFDCDRPFPYCEDIDFAFSCLMSGDLLHLLMPYGKTYQVDERLKSYFQGRISKIFSCGELGQLELMAHEFSTNLQEKYKK